MKKIGLIISFCFLLISLSGCDFITEIFIPESQEKRMERCGLNPNSFDPPDLADDCLMKPPTLCPINSAHAYHHVMVIVDTTSAFPEALANFLDAKIFDKDLWSREIEPYTRVSIIDLNDDQDPFEKKPLLSICRPPSGLINTQFSADKTDTSTKGVMIKSQAYLGNFLRPVSNSLKTLKESEEAEYTILFEQIRAVTEFSDMKFRYKDYDKRTLHIISDFMQNSKKFKFYKQCNWGNKCKNFKSLYNSNDDTKDYFDDIRPLLDENSEVYLHHILIDERTQKIRKKLEKLWTEYFIWAGVPESQVHYSRIADFEG